jgi:hypothetical protein
MSYLLIIYNMFVIVDWFLQRLGGEKSNDRALDVIKNELCCTRLGELFP